MLFFCVRNGQNAEIFQYAYISLKTLRKVSQILRRCTSVRMQYLDDLEWDTYIGNLKEIQEDQTKLWFY